MITLSSDFGSPYPAAMKGVISARSDARLVDVAHDFPRQDVRTAAFWLREVLPTFPPAVHLVVVDPGVGTDREALAVRAGEHALVGPDNGVLLPAARALAGASSGSNEGESSLDTVAIRGDDPGSSTFHGRDVFAPAAAEVHEAGIDAFDDDPGFERIGDVVDLTFPEPTVDVDHATGEVLAVDGFGNAITNVPGTVLEGRFGETVLVEGEAVPAARSYAHRDAGDRLVTVGSHGNVELAVNRGRGDEAFEAAAGDVITLRW